MCGIVALHRYSEGPSIDRAEVLAIRDAMASRGPDGKGFWSSGQGEVALGHRRLAIIGLGEQGAQPMVRAARCDGAPGRLAISFNGEIYNHTELRRELVAAGHRFTTNCDTEVLLHLYEEYADDLVTHLRGMFAFALWDEGRTRLLLARDPYGIKPLYYADDGRMLRAASQVGALLAGGGVPRATDDAALAGFLLFGNVPEPLTYSSNVRSLPAGSRLTVERGRVVGPTGFFSLAGIMRSAACTLRDERDRPEEVRQAVCESVAAHLVADVEVGVFLSAGIDSATLLATAAELRGQMSAVTLGFDEYVGTESDEVPLARGLAGLYGAKHFVSVVQQADFAGALEPMLSDMDQPSIDGINTWLVSRAAHQAGLKVALSGLGGDELFGGYSTFESVPRWAARLKWPARVPGLGRATTAALRRLLPDGTSPKAAGIIEYGRTLEQTWFVRRGLFMPWELPDLLGKERAVQALTALDLPRLLQRAVVPDPGTDFGRIAALEGALYMRNQLLRDTDWASMAHSLEVRVPLVYPVLTERVAPFTTQGWSAAEGKLPLAQVARPPLPSPVATRAKTGFSVPVGKWLLQADGHEAWRNVPALARDRCPWARRWAYTVADHFGLLAG